MKVETNLRAGSAISDAQQEADQLINQVSDFLSNASQQAEGFSSSVTTKATSLWNCLNNTFS